MGRIRGLEGTLLNLLVGKPLQIGLNLYDKGANPDIVGFVLGWYKHPEKVAHAVTEAEYADGKEIDDRLIDYFRCHLEGERAWVLHQSFNPDEFPYEQRSGDLVAKARETYDKWLGVPAEVFCDAAKTDDFLVEELQRANPEHAGHATLLVGGGLDGQLALDTLRLPGETYRTFFTTTYLASVTERDVNEVARFFLKTCTPPRPDTNISLSGRGPYSVN